MKKYLLLSAVAVMALMTSCRDYSYEEEPNRVFIEGLTVESVAHEYFEETRRQTPVISAPAERIPIDGFAEMLEIDTTFMKYWDVVCNGQKVNAKGDAVLMFHRIPKFMVVHADGKVACYKDFRNIGNENVSLDLTNCICTTCIGYVTDSYIALLTPEHRNYNWETDNRLRCLDFYSLADGTYLGSFKLPQEVDDMWIQDVNFANGLLEVYYTSSLFSEKYTYKFSKDIESLLNKE